MSVLKKILRKVRHLIRHSDTLDYLARLILIRLKRVFFRLKYCRLQLKRNKIIFECFKGKFTNDSPYAIYQELLKSGKDFDFVWVIKDKNSAELDKVIATNPMTRTVAFGSKEYFFEYATAKFWVSNCRLPYRLEKRKNQKHVQCWHGTPLKRMGFDIEIGNNVNVSRKGLRLAYKTESDRLDYFVSPSPYASKCFVSSFNMDSNKVIECGYPRNDYLLKNKKSAEEANRIKSKLGLPSEKTVVLYAPTWQDNKFSSETGTHIGSNPIDQHIRQMPQFDDFVFLYRGHNFTTTPDKDNQTFIDVSSYNHLQELLLVTDVLITDYSSIFFDFMNMDKKIIFFMTNLEEYKTETRGFYLDIENSLPGNIVENVEDLKKELNNPQTDKKRLESLNQKFNPYEDGNSSKRLVEATGMLDSI